MSRRIYFDGLNLSLERGTGIATYTRLLAGLARGLGYDVGVVYSSLHRPAKNPLLREIAFFDPNNATPVPRHRRPYNWAVDQLSHIRGVKPVPVNLSGTVVTDQFQSRLPLRDQVFVSRNLFANARLYFSWSGRFTDLEFDTRPDILHCTYQLPIRAKGACNIYTIHDLVPLRLPFTTLDNKRQTYRLLRKIGAEADHIVTVSEQSKRDIVEVLGVDEKRVTNTYEAVEFPREFVERPDDVIAEQLRGSFGLTPKNYLLFYGALEPKKRPAPFRRLYAVGCRRPARRHRCGRMGQPGRSQMAQRHARGRALPAAGEPAYPPFRICQRRDARDFDPRRAPCCSPRSTRVSVCPYWRRCCSARRSSPHGLPHCRR
jgi:glycosyltransferase involved in cell wall biosynthesis